MIIFMDFYGFQSLILDWDINPPAQQTDLLRQDVPDIAVRGSRPDFSASDGSDSNSGDKTAKEKYYGDDKDYADLLHPYSSGTADSDVKG